MKEETSAHPVPVFLTREQIRINFVEVAIISVSL